MNGVVRSHFAQIWRSIWISTDDYLAVSLHLLDGLMTVVLHEFGTVVSFANALILSGPAQVAVRLRIHIITLAPFVATTPISHLALERHMATVCAVVLEFIALAICCGLFAVFADHGVIVSVADCWGHRRSDFVLDWTMIGLDGEDDFTLGVVGGNRDFSFLCRAITDEPVVRSNGTPSTELVLWTTIRRSVTMN